jgi:hypothetical protein
MGKMHTATAAAIVTLALFGAWATTPIEVDATAMAAAGTVDVMQLTLQAKDLPAQGFPAF